MPGHDNVDGGSLCGLRRQRDDRLLVLLAAHVAAGEDLVARDPVEGFLVGFLGVGLEHQPLARTPAAGMLSFMVEPRLLRILTKRFSFRELSAAVVGALAD